MSGTTKEANPLHRTHYGARGSLRVVAANSPVGPERHHSADCHGVLCRVDGTDALFISSSFGDLLVPEVEAWLARHPPYENPGPEEAAHNSDYELLSELVQDARNATTGATTGPAAE